MVQLSRLLLACSLALSLAWGAQRASAQAVDDEQFVLPEVEDEDAPRKRKGPRKEQELLGDEQAREEEEAPREQFRETTDPHEDPKKRYVFLGARWSFMALPPGLLKAYTVESGPTVSSTSSFSAELAFRRKGFQVTAAAGFMKLTTDGAFQLKGDPIEDTEWLKSDFKLLNLTTAITWSTAFADWFSLEYGLEAGIGFVFGDMVRNEAYRRADGSWGKCETWASRTTDRTDTLEFNPDFPNPTREQQRFCQIPDGDPNEPPPPTNSASERGEQYGVKAERGLLNGGVPRAFPILGPRLSLRFKPIHQLVVRVDVPLPVFPFGLMGGVAVQYGF